MTETVLWGVKKGSNDYMEEVLYQCKGYTNEEKLMQKGSLWAQENGYDRLRISKIDMAIKPDFTKTLNKRGS
jgi:hypothetical protein